jgi:hypothetical protein
MQICGILTSSRFVTMTAESKTAYFITHTLPEGQSTAAARLIIYPPLYPYPPLEILWI